jgi:hypothetical protein
MCKYWSYLSCGQRPGWTYSNWVPVPASSKPYRVEECVDTLLSSLVPGDVGYLSVHVSASIAHVGNFFSVLYIKTKKSILYFHSEQILFFLGFGADANYNLSKYKSPGKIKENCVTFALTCSNLDRIFQHFFLI